MLNWKKLAKKKKKIVFRYILTFFIVLLIPFVFESMRKIYFMSLIIFLNAGFAFLKRFVLKIGISNIIKGIELIMFSTVVTGFMYGSGTGALIGGLCMIINYIAERRFSLYFVLTIPLYMMVGFFAGFFSDLALFGIVSTIIYNLLVLFLGIFVMKANIKSILTFSITNICFNLFMFLNFSDLVLLLV